jgi:hypothetical protein
VDLGGWLLLLALVYLVTFGALAGWLADTKHRNAPLWFLLGALLGPLAILTVGLSPEAGRTRSCPRCAELVMDEAIICPFCRHVFDLAVRDGIPDRTWEPVGVWRVTSVHDKEVDFAVADQVTVALGRTQLLLLTADNQPVVWIPYAEAGIDPLSESRLRLSDPDGSVADLMRMTGPNSEELRAIVKARRP